MTTLLLLLHPSPPLPLLLRLLLHGFGGAQGLSGSGHDGSQNLEYYLQPERNMVVSGHVQPGRDRERHGEREWLKVSRLPVMFSSSDEASELVARSPLDSSDEDVADLGKGERSTLFSSSDEAPELVAVHKQGNVFIER